MTFAKYMKVPIQNAAVSKNSLWSKDTPPTTVTPTTRPLTPAHLTNIILATVEKYIKE